MVAEKEKNNKTWIIVGIIVAVLLVSIIGTVLANRGSDDDNTSNNGNIGDNGENQTPSADFEYQYLGFSGLALGGHVASPPNSNTPLTVDFAVNSEISDEQLDTFFDSEVAPTVDAADSILNPDPLRVTYISKTSIYNSYEGLEQDYVDMQPLVAGEDDPEKMAAAKSRVEAALRKTYSYNMPSLPERDQPLTSFSNGYHRVGEDIAPGTYVMVMGSNLSNLLPVQNAESLFEVRELDLAPGISYKIEPPTDAGEDATTEASDTDVSDGDRIGVGTCRLTYTEADDDLTGWLNEDAQFQALPGSTVTVTIGASITSFSPHLDGCGTWELQKQE